MATQNPVPKLYRTVVEDVVNNVREAFLDEGLDEQVLQELKQLWESKLLQSKAVESIAPEHDQFQYASLHQRSQQQAASAQTQQPQQQQAQQVQTVQHVLTQPSSAFKTQNIEIGQPAVMPTVFAPVGGAIDLSSAAQTATLALPAGLYPQQIALNAGGITLQQTSQGHLIAVPNTVQTTQVAAGNQPQTHVTYAIAPTQVNQTQQASQPVIQLDGANDTSSEDEEYDEDEDDKDDGDDDDDDDERNEDNEEDAGEEEDPLNSGDDVSEEDPAELFDTDNVVVCQYDKINRNKNRWKFHLKDGIMNLNGRDYVFQKATGDAEW